MISLFIHPSSQLLLNRHLAIQHTAHPTTFPPGAMTSSSLLSLPRELRDDIWDKACHVAFPPGRVDEQHSAHRAPIPAHRLLRVNRQIYHEATPYVYETTVVKLAHPHEALRWIRSVGPRNSACIRHLVLKFNSLSAEPATKPNVLEGWSASLHLLPNLQALTFNYIPVGEPKEEVPSAAPEESTGPNIWAAPPSPSPELETLPEPESLSRQRSRSKDLEWQDFQPDFRFQSITHAVLAIQEPMPSMLVLYFAKLLKLSSARTLEHNITCLPTDFLAGQGFYPTRTYALTEGPPSIVFTYRKMDAPLPWPTSSSPNLNLMLAQLPQLRYLRLGCRQVDSSVLLAIPRGIQTLDIGFADPDPVRVATHLRQMRARCDQLFTLSIAVSPLHDLPPTKEDDWSAQVPDRSDEETLYWEPFWEALGDLQGSGVRIWEGEGVGFRKFTRPNATPFSMLPML